jgi:4-hydroxy-4-methyl-2-oxoglutarate aldolase
MTSETISELADFGAATLFEAYHDVQALLPNISPLYRPIHVCGPAYPVFAPAGDNLAIHYALAEAPAGSVLVVAAGGEIGKGLWGEVMTVSALARGIRGLVTDGAVRDVRAIRALNFPVFAAGVAIPGTVKQQAGVRNEPVEVGGAIIRPGDIVVGDDDGVVIIGQEAAQQALKAAEMRTRKETSMIQRLREGALTLDLLGLRR